MAPAAHLRRWLQAHREFRQMGVLRHKAHHLPQAEPRPQPVDEIGHLVVHHLRHAIGHRAPLGGHGGGIQIDERREILPPQRLLPGAQRLDLQCGQPHQIKAIAAVERVLVARLASGLDALAKQAADGVRIAQGAAGGGGNAPHRAIGAKQGRLQLAGAFPVAFEQAGQIPRQHGEHALHILAP